MKKIHFYLLLLLSPIIVLGQNEKIITLKNELINATQDTAKVNILNALCGEYFYINQYDSAIRYATPSKELAEKINYQQGMATAYRNLAGYFLHTNEYRATKIFLLKSLDAFMQTNNREAVADTYQSLYYLNEKQANYLPALHDYIKYITYRDSLATEKSATEAVIVATEAEVKTNRAIAASRAASITSFKEQKKEFIYTAAVILLMSAIAMVALFVAMGRAKTKKDLIIAAHQENIANLEDELTQLKTKQADKMPENVMIEKIDSQPEKTLKNEPITEPVNEKPTETDVASPQIETPEATVAEPEKTEIETLPLEESGVKTDEPVIVNDDVAPIVYPPLPEHIYNDTTTNNYNDPILMAQFVSFTTQLKDGNVVLQWKTANETNAAHFEIDKSIDNLQFVTIETIAAIGFGNNNYEALDLQPLPGNNYYRINMVDVNGDIIYSQPEKTDVPKHVLLELVRYPNPVKDMMMVTAVGSSSPMLVSIYNKKGQKIFSIEVPPTTTPIYLTDVPAGTYSLQMKSDGRSVLQQLVKL